MSVRLSVCVCLSVCVTICLSICLSNLSECMHDCLPTYLPTSTCLYVCLYVRQFVCLCVCLFVCLSTYRYKTTHLASQDPTGPISSKPVSDISHLWPKRRKNSLSRKRNALSLGACRFPLDAECPSGRGCRC